jgi:PAS domain S-box-containing protein
MTETQSNRLDKLDEDAALRIILEGTATQTGEEFFSALVKHLATTLGTRLAWVTEYLPDCRRLRTLAFYVDGDWVDEWEYDIDGTPCEAVVESGGLVHYPDDIMALFPNDPDLTAFNAVSYMGLPLMDLDGTFLGHLAVMDSVPMPENPRGLALVRIFADRAAAELRRLRAESKIHERERQLGRLVDGAMDAIIELGADLKLTMLNPAAEKVFGRAPGEVIGQSLAALFSQEAADKLKNLIGDMNAQPTDESHVWIPGRLTALGPDGRRFQAEASLSRSSKQLEVFYTLILRDIEQRLEAERKIRSLTVETEALKEELRALHGADEIIGESEAIRRVLEEVEQVADTDASVLIFGETGVGKELFAREIHTASGRRDMPLVKVNCAAIPAALMESEFFGHEKGAFTGAVGRRDGRFTLADGGTIFLDEVGELPIDLQPKLLRVLQEGEFEPVGSAVTKKVNVRVLAATNRDLETEASKGEFREDLFYRLNVFPISIPPLRERGHDIVRLAQEFTQRFATKMGRSIDPLSDDALLRLKAYRWPGNVRELQNVIERAVITARDGQLNLDRSLPETPAGQGRIGDPSPDAPLTRVRTVQEFQALERENIKLALEVSDWRVSGQDGAAARLGMNPSTLNSRMKALGVSRPS